MNYLPGLVDTSMPRREPHLPEKFYTQLLPNQSHVHSLPLTTRGGGESSKTVAAPPIHPRRCLSLFSITYELPLQQPPWNDNHPNCRGVYPQHHIGLKAGAVARN